MSSINGRRPPGGYGGSDSLTRKGAVRNKDGPRRRSGGQADLEGSTHHEPGPGSHREPQDHLDQAPSPSAAEQASSPPPLPPRPPELSARPPPRPAHLPGTTDRPPQRPLQPTDGPATRPPQPADRPPPRPALPPQLAGRVAPLVGPQVPRAAVAPSSFVPARPVLPRAGSGTLRATQDVVAHNMALLRQLPGATTSELEQLHQESAKLFLQGGGTREAALDLLLRTQNAFERHDLAPLAEACQTLFRAAYTEPTRLGQSAVDALVAHGASPRPKGQGGASVDPNIAALRSAVAGVEARRAAARQAGEPNFFLASEMDQILAPLNAALVPLERSQQQVRLASNIVGKQGEKASTKAKELAELHRQLPAAPANSAAGQAKGAIQAAEMLFHDGLALQGLRAALLPNPQDRAATAQAERHQDAISTALVAGVPLEGILRRAVAVSRLQAILAASPAAAAAVGNALARGTRVADQQPSFGEGPALDGYLAALHPVDWTQLRQGAAGQLGVTAAAKSLVPYLTYPNPSPVQAQGLAAQQIAAEEVLAELPKTMLALIAQVPVEARKTLAAVAHPADLALTERLSSIRAQLTPAHTVLNDNLAGRAFESILSKQIAENMPASTVQAWSILGRAMAGYVQGLTPSQQAATPAQQQRDAASWQSFQRHLKQRGSRPWDHKDPQLQHLVGLASSNSPHLKAATLALLREDAGHGYAVLTRANLVRDLWMCFNQTGGQVPNGVKANTFYRDVIGPRSRRTAQDPKMTIRRKEAPLAKQVQNPARRTATGIMAAHQPVPAGNQDALHAIAPSLAYSLDINNAFVQQSLERGAVGASGVSGSTNILLHAAEYFGKQGVQVAVRDVFLGAAEFVVHDGGHSFFEAMWVQDHFSNQSYSTVQKGTAAQSYEQLQKLFADSPEVGGAFATSLAELTGFLGNLAAKKV